MAPLRSRLRISAITSSGTCDGSSPLMTSLITPGHKRTPRQLDPREQVAGKEWRQHLDSPALAVTPLPDLRQIDRHQPHP